MEYQSSGREIRLRSGEAQSCPREWEPWRFQGWEVSPECSFYARLGHGNREGHSEKRAIEAIAAVGATPIGPARSPRSICAERPAVPSGVFRGSIFRHWRCQLVEIGYGESGRSPRFKPWKVGEVEEGARQVYICSRLYSAAAGVDPPAARYLPSLSGILGCGRGFLACRLNSRPRALEGSIGWSRLLGEYSVDQDDGCSWSQILYLTEDLSAFINKTK